MDTKTPSVEDILHCPSCGASEEDKGKSRTFCSQCRFPLLLISDRYRLESQLAVGGFGAVYLARDVEKQETVVIKVIKPEMLHSKGLLIRFRREIRITSLLSERNDHVVRILSYGEAQGVGHFYAMEYLSGQSLGDYLDVTPKRSFHDIFWLFRQFCEVMQEAHDNGIVHRDLKPDNLFVIERQGDPLFLKVLDFGIAKSLLGTANEGLTSAVMGTPHYMAPEQCTNSTIDARTDLYSMGIILYELLTQQVPFTSGNEDPLSIIFAHVSTKPPPLRKRASWLPISEELEQVVDKALAKKPAERYQSAREFWLALTQCPDFVDAQLPAKIARPLPRKPSVTIREEEGSLGLQTQPALDALDQEEKNHNEGIAETLGAGLLPQRELPTVEEMFEEEENRAATKNIRGPAPPEYFDDGSDETVVDTTPYAQPSRDKAPLQVTGVMPMATQSGPQPANAQPKKAARIALVVGLLALLSIGVALLWKMKSSEKAGPQEASLGAQQTGQRASSVTPHRPGPTPAKRGVLGLPSPDDPPAHIPDIRPMPWRTRPIPRRTIEPAPTPRRTIEPRPRRVRVAKIQTKRKKVVRRISYRRRPTSSGPCGVVPAGFRWIFGHFVQPQGGAGQLQLPGCRACRITKRAGGFCLAIPLATRSVRVKIRAPGYQACTMSLSQQQSVRWHLKVEDPDDLGGSSYYNCTR